MVRCLVFAFAAFLYAEMATALEAQCKNGLVRADGRSAIFIDQSGNSIPVYSGKYRVKALASCNGGVVTVFEGKGSDSAYFSKDCLNVGGTGNTVNVYRGNHRNEGLAQNPNGIGVYSTWRKKDGDASTYYSPDCLYLGGNGKTVRVASGIPKPPAFQIPNGPSCRGDACESVTWNTSQACTTVGNKSSKSIEIRFGVYTIQLAPGEAKVVKQLNGSGCQASFSVTGFRAHYL